MPKNTIESVLHKYANKLMATNGVVGTAIGKYRGHPCITVFVRSHDPEIRKKLPSALNGYKVRIVETGEFRAFDV